MQRLRLTVRRLLMRVPILEIPHAFCPLLCHDCECMQGWDGR